MYTSSTNGEPTPPFRHFRGNGPGIKTGGFFSRITMKQKLTILGLMLGMCASVSWVLWMFWPTDVAAEAPPTAVIATVAPITTPSVTPLPVVQMPISPVSSLEPAQIAATATFVAAINKPAAYNAPEAAPFFIGVVTYESGCNVSNLGFTTAGLNGTPYYLYFTQPLERDPLMQMVNVSGFIQQFDTCQYPIIMVQNIFWLDGQATPAPLAIGGVFSRTSTVSGTTATTNTWGVVAPLPTATPDVLITRPELLTQRNEETATPYPTYTPYPTTEPWIPPHTPIPPPPNPTKTPKPTSTPTFTPSPTPTQQANVSGPVVNIAGCAATNLAIQTGQDTNVRLILNGATLPPNGNPVGYTAVATGYLGNVCGGQAIYASSITWYLATVTPTPTATNTPSVTATPTETTVPVTPATAIPTATLTPEPTVTDITAPGRP